MKIKFTKGSDNIFKDLGLPNAEELLAKAKLAVGITAIIQPGGSVRDEEVIAAANDKKISMIFTGIRNFKH